MEDSAITQFKKRREFLHRRLSEVRAKAKDLEARIEELDGLWKHYLGRFDAERVKLVFGPDPAEAKTTSQLILHALSEFERLEIGAVERSAIVDLIYQWSSETKPNTIRVAFKRLIESHRIEKLGNLYRLPQTEAATSEKAAA